MKELGTVLDKDTVDMMVDEYDPHPDHNQEQALYANVCALVKSHEELRASCLRLTVEYVSDAARKQLVNSKIGVPNKPTAAENLNDAYNRGLEGIKTQQDELLKLIKEYGGQKLWAA